MTSFSGSWDTTVKTSQPAADATGLGSGGFGLLRIGGGGLRARVGEFLKAF